MPLTLALGLALAASTILAACEGCQRSSSARPPAAADPGPATLRLYLVSDVAGALEPCGCVKDQLGGLDHAAALVGKERDRARSHAVLSVGPLFFRDLENGADARTQEILKAETLAEGLGKIGLVAFAPGQNDQAEGAAMLSKLAARASATCLGCPSEDAGAGHPAVGHDGFVVRDLGGVRLGVLGLAPPDDGRAPDAAGRVKALVDRAKAQGAQVFVALAPLGRGEAKRIADAVPELLAVVVGAPAQQGETNTPSEPPERIGNVLVLEPANHLQSVGVLDLFVRDGSLSFADGVGIDRAKKREDVQRRIQELRARIAMWEQDGKVAAKDIEARKQDLALLQRELGTLDATPPPAQGSFFRYANVDVRPDLGTHPETHAALDAYYVKVNEENRRAFAGRLPPPAPKGTSSYVGVATCGSCHPAALAVWKKTAHSGAYATLSKDHKEYNLDCVSCHVTGYGRPGGSTVTHVDALKDVQCEVCHGPGSRHAETANKTLIVGRPSLDTCLECHHPPHVHSFDPKAKVSLVLGPGHGLPER